MGDYTPFLKKWTEPAGGISGYLSRFLASGDATFQHIAIWTLLQLLESEDKRLLDAIKKSDGIVKMVRQIAEKQIDEGGEDGGDEDEGTDGGEGEVVGLARKCAELLGIVGKGLVEG